MHIAVRLRANLCKHISKFYGIADVSDIMRILLLLHVMLTAPYLEPLYRKIFFCIFQITENRLFIFFALKNIFAPYCLKERIKDIILNTTGSPLYTTYSGVQSNLYSYK